MLDKKAQELFEKDMEADIMSSMNNPPKTKVDRTLETVLPIDEKTASSNLMQEEKKYKGEKMVKAGAVTKTNMSDYAIPVYPKLGPDQFKIIQESGMSLDEFINNAVLTQAGANKTNEALVQGILAKSGNSDINQQPVRQYPHENKFSRLKDMMAEMMEMTMMENMMNKMFNGKKSDEDMMEKIFKMKQLQMLMNDDNVGAKEKEKIADVLKEEINGLKKDIDDKNKWKDIVDQLKEKKSDDKMGIVDVLKIQGENNAKVEEMRAVAESTRMENQALRFQSQVDKLADIVQANNSRSDPSKFEELSQTVKAVKDLASQLSGEKAPSKMDSIKSILDSAMPVIKPLAEAAGEGIKQNMFQQSINQQAGAAQGPSMSEAINLQQPVSTPEVPLQASKGWQSGSTSGYRYLNVN